jgi:hypothetical protein
MRAPARPVARICLLALAALAAGCKLLDSDDPPATGQAAAEPALTEEAQAAAPETQPDATSSPPASGGESGAQSGAGKVPHIYMAVQDAGEGHPLSVIFAIDDARDGTPSDDLALRLTPEKGLCNPHEMTRYDFPAEAAPVVGAAEEAAGLTAGDLPAFMAVAVTNALLEQGLASTPEDTRPLNICTRKLWQQLVLPESARVAGQ